MYIKWIVLVALVTLNILIWPTPETPPKAIHQEASLPLLFEVDLSGEVVFPGRYYFYFPVTIETLIGYAGGALDSADLSLVNLRMTISKEAHITIPKIKTDDGVDAIKINLNQANFQTLFDLPYISESMALQILMYRQQHGPFQHIDELLNVKYIGPATLEKIKDYFILG